MAYGAASTADHIEYGLQVDTLEASNLTLTPANFYNPWMLLDDFYPSTSGATVDASAPFSFDIKSRRKVQYVQETLWFSWRPVASGNSSLTGLFNVLLALP
jgi:hypothetical protein